MFCFNCGTKIPDESVFCYKCGKKIVLPEAETMQNETNGREGEAATDETMKNTVEKATTDETEDAKATEQGETEDTKSTEQNEAEAAKSMEQDEAEDAKPAEQNETKMADSIAWDEIGDANPLMEDETEDSSSMVPDVMGDAESTKPVEPLIIPHTVLLERAIEESKGVLKKNHGCHLKGNIDKKLFDVAMEKYGGDHKFSLSDVYLLYDDTLMATSGSLGFMITSTGILTSRKNEISFFNVRHIKFSSYDLLVTDQYGKEYELYSPDVDRDGLEVLFQNIDEKLPEIKKSMEYLMNLSKESVEKAQEWLDEATKNAVQLYETQKEQKIQELTKRYNAWLADWGILFTHDQKMEFLENIRKDPFKQEKELQMLMQIYDVVKDCEEEENNLPKMNTTQMTNQIQQRKVYKDLKIGDVIELGKWKYEIIEWHVIAFEDDWAVLLSKEAIDYQIYDSLPGAKWTESYLYRWCNNDFYKQAFTSEEKKAIARRISNNKNIGTVLVLSRDEVKAYLPRARDRLCSPSWVLEKDVQRDLEGDHYGVVDVIFGDSNYVVWWIMKDDEECESDFHSNENCVIRQDGTIDTRDYRDKAFVRPVIRVNVNWLQGNE